MVFGCDRLQIFTFIATDELRRLALFIFLWQKSDKNPADRKLDRLAPSAEIVNETIAGGRCSERNQDVATETLGPAIVDRAKTMRAGPFSFESVKELAIDPLVLVHSFVLSNR